MNTAIQDVETTWRDAERLLESLPPLDPDHETVLLAVALLRQTRDALVMIARDAAVGTIATLDTIAEARELIARVEAKRHAPHG